MQRLHREKPQPFSERWINCGNSKSLEGNDNKNIQLQYEGSLTVCIWVLDVHAENNKQVFINKCLCRIVNVHWPDKISNNYLRTKVICLSTCPPVCPVPDHKWRTERRSKQKISRKEDNDTSYQWPHLEVERSNVKVTTLISSVTKNQPYLRNGKAYELQTWYMDGVRVNYIDMRGDLKSQRLRLKRHVVSLTCFCP